MNIALTFWCLLNFCTDRITFSTCTIFICPQDIYLYVSHCSDDNAWKLQHAGVRWKNNLSRWFHSFTVLLHNNTLLKLYAILLHYFSETMSSHQMAIISRKATGDISWKNWNSLESKYFPVTAWHYQAATYYTSEGNIPAMTLYLFPFTLFFFVLSIFHLFNHLYPNASAMRHCGPMSRGW